MTVANQLALVYGALLGGSILLAALVARAAIASHRRHEQHVASDNELYRIVASMRNDLNILTFRVIAAEKSKAEEGGDA